MTTTTAEEANKALVRKVIEGLVDERDFDLLDETHANDFVLHSGMGTDGEVSGLEAYKAAVQAVFEAFPDLRLTIEDLVAEDDLVAYRVAYSGTHQGDFMGAPATGKTVSWEGMALARIVDGRFAELRAFTDNLDLMQQLDVTEVPSA